MKKSGVGTLHSSGCFRYKEPEVQKSYSESVSKKSREARIAEAE